jgi:hypothetical protein
MRRAGKVALWASGLYALAWTLYVVKSVLRIDLMPAQAHEGMFPGSFLVQKWAGVQK